MNTQPLDLVTYTDRLFQAVTAGDDYSNEVDRRQAEIVAKGTTEDDVYELGESLQSRDSSFRMGLLLAIRTGINCDAMIRDELAKITMHRALNEAINSMDN